MSQEAAQTARCRAILDQTAKATRTIRLTRRICGHDAPDLNWHRFWVAPREGSFFGEYADDTPGFGEPGEIESLSTAPCKLHAVDYDEFALEGHQQAVLADIRALFLISRILYGEPRRR